MEFNRRRFVGAAAAASYLSLTSATIARACREGPAAAPAPVPAAPKADEPPSLLRQAIAALDTHDVAERDLVGLVDFSAHSSKRRFQLVDVAGGKILGAYLVAHGKGSDPGHTGWVEKLSNQPGSNASSQGSYLISNDYYGKHGHSRRLVGLDPTNDEAMARAIVLHGASYVDPGLIGTQGTIGRSLGCFAVAEDRLGEVMDRLGEGRLLFAGKSPAA